VSTAHVELQKILRIFGLAEHIHNVNDTALPKPNWPSYCQLVQQLISGTVRRNTFTQWEMKLLLDVQMIRMRKSSRSEMLRRYLRVIERQVVTGSAAPLRFAHFVEDESRSRKPISAEPALSLPRAS